MTTSLRLWASLMIGIATNGCSAGSGDGPTEECVSWRGTRFCFPMLHVVGIGTSFEGVSANVRVPLEAAELRQCNARASALDRDAFDYDNVDVMLTSVADGVTPAELYTASLSFHLGAAIPSPTSAGRLKCWPHRPDRGQAGVTCLEREAGDGEVYVTTCSSPNGVGVAGCSDEKVSGLFKTAAHYERSCFAVRGTMRRHIQQYFSAHRSDYRG